MSVPFELATMPVVPVADPFGNVIDDQTVERALTNTLKRWMDAALAHQERRWGMTQGSIVRPRSWPTLSRFEIKLQDQLPAVLVVFNGTELSGMDRKPTGDYREVFSYDVTVAVAGISEQDAREIASKYIAAVKTCVLQNRKLGDPTLGSVAEWTRMGGPLVPRVGVAGNDVDAHRAIYTITFHVQVDKTICDRMGPVAPPDDPYSPSAPALGPLEASIIVQATLEDTP